MLGDLRPARADILMTVSAGAFTSTYDFASNTIASQITTIDGYTANIQTIVTNYPGPAGGLISTNVNISGTTGTPATLTVTAQLVNPIGSPVNSNLLWNTQSSPVTVTAGTTFAPQTGVTSGTVTTNTYFASTSSLSTTGLTGTPVTATTSIPGGSPGFTGTSMTNTSGTYTLSETLTISGLNVGAGIVNFGGTSSVTAVPEPSSMAIAGLGALGMIGYGLRRRKALGA